MQTLVSVVKKRERKMLSVLAAVRARANGSFAMGKPHCRRRESTYDIESL
jgi:hypothetical protein